MNEYIKKANIFIKFISGFIDKLNAAKDIWLQSRIKIWATGVINRYKQKKLYTYERLVAIFIEPLITKDIITPANLITFMRIPLALIVFLFMYNEWFIWALITFILACLLDLIDGPVARALNCISDTGKILDPLADKILLAAVFIPFGIKYLTAEIFYPIAFVELILIVISATLKPFGKQLGIQMKIQSNLFGKIKFVLECIGAGFLLLIPAHPQIIAIIANTVFALAIPFAFASLFGYLSSIKIIKKTSS